MDEIEKLQNMVMDQQAENERLKMQIDKLKAWNRKFFDRVRFMRACQKDYFKSRRNADIGSEELKQILKRSTDVEHEVDAIIADLVAKLEAREGRQRVEEAKQLLIDKFDAVEQ